MSTLRCTNIADTSGGNSLSTAQIFNGSAKAWVNFNGTGTVSIRAQFNVSSITDNGTGSYTLNFSTALLDGNYSAVGMCKAAAAGGAQDVTFTTTAPSSAALPIFTSAGTSGNQSLFDADIVAVTVNR